MSAVAGPVAGIASRRWPMRPRRWPKPSRSGCAPSWPSVARCWPCRAAPRRRAFLAALGERDLAWDKVTLLPTDERFVSPGDPASNERMIRASFRAIARGQGALPLLPRPRRYTRCGSRRDLAELAALPAIDILISGMGADGHIASLFPGEAAAVMTAPVFTRSRPIPPDCRRASRYRQPGSSMPVGRRSSLREPRRRRP
jgi:hypothetical protein